MSRTEPVQELPELLYAVLDANILMHFQYVNQLDWPTALGAKEVCLVCTPMLFQELDDLKDRDKRPGRGELARRVSKTLQTPLDDAPANVAVPLPQRTNTYVMSWEEDDFDISSRLRKEKRDDHYVAAALHFQANNPEASLVLVAHDFNLQRRAKRFGIPARSLPDHLRRALPLTDEEQRLKRLEANEPKIRIDVEGVTQDVMLLPYGERADAIHSLHDYYKNELVSIIEALTGKYNYFRQKHGHAARTSLLENNIDPRDSRSRNALSALREFGLSIVTELLLPRRTATATLDSRASGNAVYEEYKEQLDEWETLVNKFYDLTSRCVTQLATARRDHQYYLLNVSCTHTDGAGIQDGKLTVSIEPTFSLSVHPPPTEVERKLYVHSREPVPTVWQDVLESSDSPRPSYYEKVYPFGNLHPRKSVICSSLYIEVAQHSHPSDSTEAVLTVELTGLNVREPIRREITVTLSHAETPTIWHTPT